MTELQQWMKDCDVRVIDQRIGAGIGGFNTILRIWHRPSGIIIEVPRVTSTQHYDREIGYQMIEAALTHPKFRGRDND